VTAPGFDVASRRSSHAQDFLWLQTLDLLPQIGDEARPVPPRAVHAMMIVHVVRVSEQNSIVAKSLGGLEELVNRDVKLLRAPRECDDQYRSVYSALGQDRQKCVDAFVHRDPSPLGDQSKTVAAGQQLR
jgi:hypothetical protein